MRDGSIWLPAECWPSVLLDYLLTSGRTPGPAAAEMEEGSAEETVGGGGGLLRKSRPCGCFSPLPERPATSSHYFPAVFGIGILRRAQKQVLW
jgi:hypothetical protein